VHGQPEEELVDRSHAATLGELDDHFAGLVTSALVAPAASPEEVDAIGRAVFRWRTSLGR
jgi:hypothetical protein